MSNSPPNLAQDPDGEGDDPEEDLTLYDNFCLISLEAFLDLIKRPDFDEESDLVESGSDSNRVFAVTARVNIESLVKESLRKRSDAVANSVWETMHYRFTYQSKYVHKRTDSTRFIYHCCQNASRQHKPEKVPNPDDTRDKIQMDSFACRGWLHVTVFEGSNEAYIKLNHKDEHVSYWCIDVPTPVKEFVRQNASMRPSQLWTEILARFPNPKFSRASIYSMWMAISSQEWKRDADELKSARVLIDEASRSQDKSKGIYQVENIPLPEDPEDGFTALAFSLTPVLRQWGGAIREISLDSAWNTNKARFEIFALLGELYGSGCPLGYLLIQSTPNHLAGVMSCT
ncbi:hypothetical protein V5O48_019104, partial [Marasmius crinis-equi]